MDTEIIFLTEELSMKSTLEVILPKIIPNIDYIIISHSGKSDLQESIPRKLRAWNKPADFVILHDKDSADCVVLKDKLLKLCINGKRPDTLIRIVCTELESWFLGDLQAVAKAYNKPTIAKKKDKAKYRNPDTINDASEELERLCGDGGKITRAKKIAPKMDISQNKSHSLQIFIAGLQKMIKKVQKK